MKPHNTQPPTTEDSREGLHTQLNFDEYGLMWDESIHPDNRDYVCQFFNKAERDFDNWKVYAELIVKAVNSYQELTDRNAEMKKDLGDFDRKIDELERERQKLLDKIDVLESLKQEAFTKMARFEKERDEITAQFDKLALEAETLQDSNTKLLDSNRELLEALQNLVNLSYETARPTKAEKEFNIEMAVKAIANAKNI